MSVALGCMGDYGTTMSSSRNTRRTSVPDIVALKGQRPIVALTAYTAPFASLLDVHSDILLVGDSLGMVLYGMDSTLPVTLDDMIRHGRCVAKASAHACVIVDLPFGSYQTSPQQAFASAAQVMKETGAQGVKLEGGAEMAETIAFLTARAIPVMAHIGLQPQHVHTMGGYRYQGRNEAECARLRDDAQAIANAGAFAVVLEGIDATLAAELTESLTIPTIGIGAGITCDGQILVSEDMLGLSERTPKFVRRYGELGETITEAAKAYAASVKDGTFPSDAETYGRST